MQASVLVPVVVGSYLLGSISFSRLVSKLAAPNADVEAVPIPGQSGDNPQNFSAVGATVTSLKLGGRVGCLVSLLDAFKVFLPTLLLRIWMPGEPYYLAAALAGLVGNNWPIFYRFRGGWGISAIYGGYLAIDPLGSLVCAIAGMIVGLFVLRDLLAIYMLGLWLMIPWVWYFNAGSPMLPYLLGYLFAANLIMFLALVPELRAYLKMRREGASMADLMDLAPMGRGMKKMLKALGME